MNSTDHYLKKTIDFKYSDKFLKFKVSQKLFSSTDVDSGTKRLLRSIQSENLKYSKVLDLGCGYGPIGISLKAVDPNSDLHMIDRDALALDFSTANCVLNNLDDVWVYGSLGYSSVEDYDFDLIVSNIPAKVGESVLKEMLLSANSYLTKSGLMVVVVIDEIVDVVKKILADDNIEIVYHKQWPGHHVFHYKFVNSNLKPSNFDINLYTREIVKLSLKSYNYDLVTGYHLPEFERLSFVTELLINRIKKLQFKSTRSLVFNPGQGYIPLAINVLFRCDELILVDQNLLALEISKYNLTQNGFDLDKLGLIHQVGLDLKSERVDLIVGIIPEKSTQSECDRIIEKVEKALVDNGHFVIASSSTVVTRIVRSIKKRDNLIVLKSFKKKGNCVLTVKFA